MNLREITPLILTYNEAPNLRRALDSIGWARKVIVIDSGSDDETQSICSEFPQVSVISRPFDNHTDQWNFGLDQVQTVWVLTMDADYQCPTDFEKEIVQLTNSQQAYSIPFRYSVFGKILRGTLYPRRVALFEKQSFRYVRDGHTQLLDISNKAIGKLQSAFIHDDRKSLARWLKSQQAYAELECKKLCSAKKGSHGWKDRTRTWIVVAPVLTFVYCLIYKRLLLDGRAGLLYTLQRTYAELLLSLHIATAKFPNVTSDGIEAKNEPPHVT